MSEMAGELEGHLRQLRRWMKARDAGVLAQRSLWLAALAALLVQTAGRFWPLEKLWLWSLLPFAVWLVAVLAWFLFRPVPAIRVARRTDLELHLKEKLSTAWVLAGQRSEDSPTGEARALARLQQEDALATARNINARHAFRTGWHKRPLAAALAMGMLVVVLAILPNPMDGILAERADVREELAEQSRRVEELSQELEQEESLSAEERAELLRQLEELARQLRENPGDREKALADFARMEENLRRQLQPDAASQQAALESLAAQLEALAREEGEAGEDPADPSEAFEQLASELGEMETSQQQALAQSLAELAAQAAQSGEQALASALSAMAQAALNGDPQAASQAAQQAGEALEQATQNAAAQQSLSQALNQLQASREAVARAGQPGQTAQNQNANQPGNQPGQNQGQSSGQSGSQGQNPGQGQAQGMSGGGTRANTLPPGQGQGQAGQPQGLGQQANAGRLDDQVYVPFANPGTNGEEIFIPGQDTGQGETEVREGQDPLAGAANPALVPYQQVFGQYLQAANQAVESGTIPLSLRDYIKAYFTQLEP